MPELAEVFRHFAHSGARLTGSVLAFLAALFAIAVWIGTGPVFGFSDTWQLVINTGTTIVTYLMVFLIQNTQNRDSEALHAKLDELLVATGGARNRVAIAEDMSETVLGRLKHEYEELARDEEPAELKRTTHRSRRRITREAE